jgi:hypothetical protein
MLQYVNEPEVGKAYKTREGVVIVVEEVKLNGYWLCRFIRHPYERNRAGHRQWVPLWSRGFFEEITLLPKFDESCCCAACTTQIIPVIAFLRTEVA